MSWLSILVTKTTPSIIGTFIFGQSADTVLRTPPLLHVYATMVNIRITPVAMEGVTSAPPAPPSRLDQGFAYSIVYAGIRQMAKGCWYQVLKSNDFLFTLNTKTTYMNLACEFTSPWIRKQVYWPYVSAQMWTAPGSSTRLSSTLKNRMLASTWSPVINCCCKL